MFLSFSMRLPNRAEAGTAMADVLHPLHLANALEVLSVELEEELKGKDAALALSLLRIELAFAVDQGRAWAAERGLPFDFRKPDTDWTAQECLVLLRSVADVLRELASRGALGVMNDNGWSDDD